MKQLFDQKQQPDRVIFGIVENVFLYRRLIRRAWFERRPQIAGSHAVKTMRLFAETFAQSSRRERKQGADSFHAELEKRIAKLGLDVQAAQRHFARDALFLSGIAKNRDAFFRLDDGIAAEAREADRKIYCESLRPQIFVNGIGPLSRRSVEALQPGAIQPKDAGLFSRRLDFGSKAHQT